MFYKYVVSTRNNLFEFKHSKLCDCAFLFNAAQFLTSYLQFSIVCLKVLSLDHAIFVLKFNFAHIRLLFNRFVHLILNVGTIEIAEKIRKMENYVQLEQLTTHVHTDFVNTNYL